MKTQNIETWQECCRAIDLHPGIAPRELIEAQMQAEIDALRRVYDCARTLVTVRGRFHTEQAFRRLEAVVTNAKVTGAEGVRVD